MMARRKNNNWLTDSYWQSRNFNQIAYNSFRDQIINIATSRFKWLNLPETCDERYLERILLFEGCATIARPKTGAFKDMFFSTQLMPNKEPNIYDNYIAWDSVGNNGWRFSCDASNGVVIWDNRNRTPITPMINMLARELADIMRTKTINRMHQKIPYILVGPEEKKMDMTNIFKQIAGNEPAIIATNGLSSIEIKALQTDVEYLADKFEEDIRQTWNTVYTLLGIENVQEKKERQIYGELNAQKYPDMIMNYNYIECRRYAAEQLNKRFGLNIKVVKANDNFSDNYNLQENMKQQAEMGLLDNDTGGDNKNDGNSEPKNG